MCNTTCCVTDGDIWSAKSPGGPNNRRKLRSQPTDGRSTGVQLKKAAKFLTVVGLITKHIFKS